MIKKIIFNLLGFYNCKNCHKDFWRNRTYHATINHWQSTSTIDGVKGEAIYKTTNISSIQYCSKKCMMSDIEEVKHPKPRLISFEIVPTLE